MMLALVVSLLTLAAPPSNPAPPEIASVSLPPELPEPSLVVLKSRRELRLLSNGELVRTYRIGLGVNPERPKERQGDGATPVGTYYVCVKNPQSKYELSLGISYPGPADAERGLAEGQITRAERARILAAWKARRTPPWNTRLGGEIMIHGEGSDADWTAGCVALDNGDIHELYRVVPVGTPVEIRP